MNLKKSRPYLYLLPAMVFLGIFVYWPILRSVDLSFRSWNFLTIEKPLVGLKNYVCLFQSERFRNSFYVTAVMVFFIVPLRLILALFLSNFLLGEDRENSFFRVLYFLPFIMSYVSVGLIWSWIFNGDFGILSRVSLLLNLTPLQWFLKPNLARSVLVILSIWKELGYDIILFVAGIQSISKDYYEAARIDGAGLFHIFLHITFPLVSPVTYFLLIVSVINSFQMFTVVDVMTKGGPGFATDVLVNLLYRTSFVEFNIGKGSALAIVLFLFLLILTYIKNETLGKVIHYE